MEMNELKEKGNSAFKQGKYEDAVNVYKEILKTCEEDSMKITIFENLAACFLKLRRFENALEACNNSLAIEPRSPKALYRSAQANFQMGKFRPALELLQRLLSLQPTNVDAKNLMRDVRIKVEKEQQELSSPVAIICSKLNSQSESAIELLPSLTVLCSEEKSHSVDFARKGGLAWCGAILDRHIDMLIPLSQSIDPAIGSPDVDGETTLKLLSKVIRVIAAACSHTEFVRHYIELNYCRNVDTSIRSLNPSFAVPSGKLCFRNFCSLLCHNNNEIFHGAIYLVMEVLKSTCAIDTAASTNESPEVPFEGCLGEYEARSLIKGCLAAIHSGNAELFTMTTDVVAAFLSDSPDYIHSEKPVDTRYENIVDRKARLSQQRRRKEQARQHALWSLEEGLLEVVMFRLDSENPLVRQRAGICLGRVIAAVNDDERMKSLLRPYLAPIGHDLTTRCAFPDSSSVNPSVYFSQQQLHPMQICRIRATIETALFLSMSSEIGVWSLQQPEKIKSNHSNSIVELKEGENVKSGKINDDEEGVVSLTEGVRQLLLLIGSGDERCQEVAAELSCLVAVSEKGGPMLSPLVSSGALHSLLKSPIPGIRTAAASTLTKLSLKAKALSEDSAELTHVLNTVLSVLKTSPLRSDASPSSNNIVKPPTSYQDSLVDAVAGESVVSTERAVEILASLVGKTHVKEEIVHGSFRVAAALPLLLSLDVDLHSTLAYGIAHILAALTVSNHELRAKALAEKDMTTEQFNQLQELQRIKTTDENGNEVKEKLESDDPDTPDLVNQRIRKIVSLGGISFLVKLLTPSLPPKASEKSTALSNKPRASTDSSVKLTPSTQAKEAIARTFRQICVFDEARGLMIAEGGLKVATKFALDSEESKSIRREFAHAIAKTLVTTNPFLLSEHARLGCISPLLFLCKDVDSSNLQQFEALLSLTNLVSMGQEEKDKFCAEKGVNTVHYLMFSDHNMVQRAATEALCNLADQEDVLKILRKNDMIRLWLGLSEDWDKDIRAPESEDAESVVSISSNSIVEGCESFLVARAASGTLGVASADPEVCAAMLKEGCAGTLAALLASNHQELVHRALVILLNISEAGGPEMCKHLLEGGVVPYLSAVLKSQQAEMAELAREVSVNIANALKNYKE